MKNSTKKKLHYTIVEMMMVVAIFMIILAMAIVAWSNSSSQTQLKNAARLVSKQLNLARAKAIAEHKEIGVFFSGTSDDADKQYAMVVCAEGKAEGNEAKIINGEFWRSLPGGIVFSKNKPSSTGTVNATAPDAVRYSKNGSLVSNDTEFYLASGDQTNGKVYKNVPYYTVKINPFTGRSTLTYHE